MSSSKDNLEKYLIPPEEIRLATQNFSPETQITDTSYSNFYKGQLSERWQNRTVAIQNYQRDGCYFAEKQLRFLSRLHHDNIIPFIGYCNENDEMNLVTEYAANRRLIDHLQDPNKRLSLTWPQRLKICIGAANALNYLHSGHGDNCRVIHRNVNSHTILLDEKLEAKLSDFNDAIEVGGNQEHIYEEARGYMYYMDPIYRESGFHKTESDVYSLGVVMFELLSGMPANHRRDIGYGEPQPLVNLARIYHDDGLDNIIDPYIKNIIDKRSLRTFKEIAYRCISFHLRDRPSMDSIIKRMKEALEIQCLGAASTIRTYKYQNLQDYVIPLEEIILATRNFNKETIVTKARLGMVYQGQLSRLWGNQTAAFKRFDLRDVYAEHEFRYELRMITNFNHENIIDLIGYCDEGNEMILAYRYASNGSLDLHLQDENKRRCLRWEQRLKICIGVVRGLNNLRSDHGEDSILVHRNLICPNILLDDNMKPLITGLNASKVIEIDQGQFFDFPSIIMHYHLDPIYRASGIVKAEADIYSLGVILFEILSGMLAYDTRVFEHGKPLERLMKRVRRCYYEDGMDKLIDPLIKDQIDISSFLVFKEIASKCISLNVKDRPSLNRVINRLEEALHIQSHGGASNIATQSHASHQYRKLEDFKVPLEEISLATGGFSQETWIGKGGFGDVYKGQSSQSWQNSTVVAIKRLYRKGRQGKNEFKNELNLMYRFQHQNIINLIGYCDEENEMILVNEYASNGSLEDYLEDVYKNKRCSLTWVERLRICIGAARGLDYLHWGLGENNRVIHRDVKSGNILLDDKLQAKICDFGLSKSGPPNQPQSKHFTRAAGTRFYMDPVYNESGMLQKESDVYSLGVVLFELLTGMLAYYKKAMEKDDEPQFLINLVRRYFDDGLDMLIDSFITDQIDRCSFHIFKYIAYECISLNSKDRPTMDTIIDKLEEALEFQISKESPAKVMESESMADPGI